MSDCCGFGIRLILTLRRRFGQLLRQRQTLQVRRRGVAVGLQLRRRQQIIRPGSRAAAQVVCVVINSGPEHRKGLTCGPEAPDDSYSSTAVGQ